MAPSEGFASIADASKPNTGRFYVFVLGGNHNFEVDRLSAEKIRKIAPLFPKVPRPDTQVIYSDIDPITVAYGQEILKDDPNVGYAACEAGKPEQLLTSPLPAQLYDTFGQPAHISTFGGALKGAILEK